MFLAFFQVSVFVVVVEVNLGVVHSEAGVNFVEAEFPVEFFCCFIRKPLKGQKAAPQIGVVVVQMAKFLFFGVRAEETAPATGEFIDRRQKPMTGAYFKRVFFYHAILIQKRQLFGPVQTAQPIHFVFCDPDVLDYVFSYSSLVLPDRLKFTVPLNTALSTQRERADFPSLWPFLYDVCELLDIRFLLRTTAVLTPQVSSFGIATL